MATALKIFISSVMRITIEDLGAERQAAYDAVEVWSPVARAWAFEKEPASTKLLRESYIDEVKTCDLLLLIIGRTMTPGVRGEFDTAQAYGKPILAFVKTMERDREAEEVVRLLFTKYDRFVDAADLREKARAAVGHEILRRARPETVPARTGDWLTYLRGLPPGSVVHMRPLVPNCPSDLFSIRSAEPNLVVLQKSGTGESAKIPSTRIAEVLMTDASEAPVVLLDGRLQWTTVGRQWRFFPELPNANDPLQLGIAKEGSRQKPLSEATSAVLAARGFRYSWARTDRLADRLADSTHEVFYDEDGRYLLSRGPDIDAILVISPVGS